MELKYIEPFWDDEFKDLDYRKEIFNDEYAIEKWRRDGYENSIESFSGEMANYKDRVPSWNNKFLDFAKECGLNDVGVCYYRMGTNEIIPKHSDAYNVYTEKFNCKTEDVQKILFFLDDWKSGHYFELRGHPFVGWVRGNYAQWNGSTEHFAANIGTEFRYTLQITGHR